MTDSSAAKLRRPWLNAYLWIGLRLTVLPIPIFNSGRLQVFHDDPHCAVKLRPAV